MPIPASPRPAAVKKRSPLSPIEVPWQQRPVLPLAVAAEISGVSPASLYRFASEGRLKFRRLAGRTLVETPSLMALVDAAESWTPSNRGSAARAQRQERARAGWAE